MERAQMTAAPSQLTPEQWKRVGDALRFAHASAEMECDGFKLGLQVQHVDALKLGISVFVNGWCRGQWILNDCEERRRFLQPTVSRLYSHAQKARIVERIGKKRAADWYPNLDKTYTSYSTTWTAFSRLKRHLLKHNASIRLVSINGIEEPQA